jgi:hypothetical protein
MKRLKTKILSVVIATALIFSMIPATVFGAVYNPEDGNIEAFFSEIASMFASEDEIRAASAPDYEAFIALIE